MNDDIKKYLRKTAEERGIEVIHRPDGYYTVMDYYEVGDTIEFQYPGWPIERMLITHYEDKLGPKGRTVRRYFGDSPWSVPSDWVLGKIR